MFRAVAALVAAAALCSAAPFENAKGAIKLDGEPITWEPLRAEDDENITWMEGLQDEESFSWISRNMMEGKNNLERELWSGSYFLPPGAQMTLDPTSGFGNKRTVIETNPGSYLEMECDIDRSTWFWFYLWAMYDGTYKRFSPYDSSVAVQTTEESLVLYLRHYAFGRVGVTCYVRAVSNTPTTTTTTTTPDPNTITTRDPNTCTCGIANSASRIVGGTQVQNREIPWVVLVLISTSAGTFGCGGTIVSPRHVVTAAHCTVHGDGVTTQSVRILYGVDNYREGSRKIMTAKTVHNHPQYGTPRLANDIAVLEMPEDIEFDDTVSPACLPDANVEYGNMNSVIAGWGRDGDGNSPEDLFKVEIPLGTNDYCEREASNAYNGDYMICNKFVRGLDSCQGDSGGPVTVVMNGKHHLVGAVSFGPSPCAQMGPGVNTRITSYLDFIKNIITSNNDQICA